MLLVCSVSQAKEFTFKYKLNDTSLEVKQNSDDRNEAFERASKQCFDFYKNKKAYSKEYWLDVIDICVNPR